MLLSDLKTFTKKKDYLICIDSDGTAMDVMTVKHKKCFGPCFVKEWGLEQWNEDALRLWDDINLYSKTRGYNRFLTLYKALEVVNEKMKPIEGLADLKQWIDTTKQLSNQALKEAAERNKSQILQKALQWSQAVNAETVLLTYDDKKPFDGVKEFLKTASAKADIAVVSSAGFKIIEEEWWYHKLIDYVGVIAAQEDGSKQDCLMQLSDKGYKKDKMLMIGDALSDMNAADESGVLFYPIRVGHESESWKELKNDYFRKFLDGSYVDVQADMEARFNAFFKD